MHIEKLTLKNQNGSRTLLSFYTRKSLSHAIVFVAGISMLGNSILLVAADHDPVALRGLQHTNAERPLLESAIKSANLMTKANGPTLTPSWTWNEGDAQSVPVYLVKSPAGAISTPAVVPRDCTCVFVNLPAFEAWLNAHSKGSGRMTLESKHLLTFMLLHEVGHLSKNTTGAEFSNGSLSQLNTEPALAKAREEAADEFAAELVREWSRSTSDFTTSIEANWVANELTKLSWNMQAYRTLDEFGALETGKPLVFFDQNMSHPNLAWRILRSNHLIQQSEETKALLHNFEEARQKGADPLPLYQSP
ncbi:MULTISPECIES: hypothetical protein [Pseudomonas]|jgi:hypothetical protein|uniref:Peptidase n=4 Tax=Pseudomonas TaxID=286 RepID=A0A7W2L6J4_PSEPU|nr:MULTISPECIES: hypothetical protein [Pseudomonas]MBA6119375.1 hypothetical protein [Pseudomonas putida]MBF4560421.1 hypothetical protein [Pseudomonas sp. p50(2008)]MBX9410615.1 hypothetical protein [Pseudomonas baetica]MCO1619273.1 hypothetical protein [Pseudomonas putida]MCT8950825.1 hypothetical protein [Pseudomonas iridis]|tara:strand:- start:3415 stop:4332 length:918 start_codon:yes stop_codon:yes gene_type:complete